MRRPDGWDKRQKVYSRALFVSILQPKVLPPRQGEQVGRNMYGEYDKTKELHGDRKWV